MAGTGAWRLHHTPEPPLFLSLSFFLSVAVVNAVVLTKPTENVPWHLLPRSTKRDSF